MLTFFPRMPRLLWTSCAMRKREGSCGQLAEENQKCKHSPATVKQTKTKKQIKNRKTPLKKNPWLHILELSHRPVVLKATGLLCFAPGFSRPGPTRAQISALRAPGGKHRGPGLYLRLSGHRSPRTTHSLEFESGPNHDPTGAK